MDKVVEEVTKTGFKDRYIQQFGMELRRIADNRFGPNSKLAFDLAKKMTKYNLFEKRDGGLVAAAYDNGKLLEGEELEAALIGHYRRLHTKLPGFSME